MAKRLPTTWVIALLLIVLFCLLMGPLGLGEGLAHLPR